MSTNAITIYNKKGGTGKTSIAFSLAKDLNLPLLSNDDSVIEEAYPGKAKVLDVLKVIEHDCVYDLGGFVDEGIIELFEKSSVIVIPTTLDANALKRTVNSVMEINRYNQNIVLIINRVKKNTLTKYKQAITMLEALGFPVLYMRESEAIANSMYEKLSIEEQYNKSALNKYNLKGIYKDYILIKEEVIKYA